MIAVTPTINPYKTLLQIGLARIDNAKVVKKHLSIFLSE